MNVLSAVYSNKASVDDELIEVIKKPADCPGGFRCFGCCGDRATRAKSNVLDTQYLNTYFGFMG